MKATIEQWRVFRALVEHGTYARAADAMERSVSSVHTAVRNLQSALGVRLFAIEARRVALTATGRALVPHANRLVEQADAMEALASRVSTGIESTVRVAIDGTYPRAALLDVLDDAARAFPHVHLELHESVLRGALELLEAGRVQLAITPYPPASGSFRTLGRVRFVPAAHPGHPLHALRRPLGRDDLRAHRHVVVRDSAERLAESGTWFEAIDTWTVDSVELSMEIIGAGLGFAWLPVSRIRAHLDDGRLAVLPMQKLNDRHVEIFLAWSDRDVAGPVCRHLIERLEASCENALHD